MDNKIKELLEKEKIEYAGIIPFSECRVINQSLIDRSWQGGEIKSAVILLVPYYTGDHKGHNVSLYAISRDYHLYFKGLYSRLERELTAMYPGHVFKGYADHSPIGETGAAAKAGLGVIGDKFQLINEKYGSYTFIGEILTDAEFDCYDLHEVGFCSHCGKCGEACPVKEGCFSDMTQKKGEIDGLTASLIRKYGVVWGCDICRTSCPMNEEIAETPIEFFREELTPVVTAEMINSMTKDEFSSRAYSWRGKNTILRNLNVLETQDNDDPKIIIT